MSETSPELGRRMGRGVFLATVAGGVSSLVWGVSTVEATEACPSAGSVTVWPTETTPLTTIL